MLIKLISCFELGTAFWYGSDKFNQKFSLIVIYIFVKNQSNIIQVIKMYFQKYSFLAPDYSWTSALTPPLIQCNLTSRQSPGSQMTDRFSKKCKCKTCHSITHKNIKVRYKHFHEISKARSQSSILLSTTIPASPYRGWRLLYNDIFVRRKK